ncbi:MAG: oxidoreductase [Alphaproteobacteria bacterium]|nr:oxidoreductase [Alphaproteobacteria bacterium]|tara:strand:+ start:517 stop:1257 length:741 start_codon:yes stop_codon:yes gene_type:complete
MTDTNYKKALVTGATSGIGLETAIRLAESGIHVTAAGRRKEKLIELQNKISCDIIEIDVREQEKIYSEFGELEVDILINNAGVGKGFSPIFLAEPDDINTTTETNVTSFLHLLRAVVPGMVNRKKGHIINIGSIAGLYPVSSSVYGGSKGAVHMINQNLRVELSGTGVRATEICPGRVNTEFFDVAFSDNPDKRKQMTSGLKLLEQEDVADAIMFAINAPWRMNVSMIELTPTEQVPGGSIIKEAK